MKIISCTQCGHPTNDQIPAKIRRLLIKMRKTDLKEIDGATLYPTQRDGIYAAFYKQNGWHCPGYIRFIN